MIDGQNILNQPVKNNLRAYDNISKIEIGQGDDYTTDYDYFNKYYKMIPIGFSKGQALESDPKVIEQISFT